MNNQMTDEEVRSRLDGVKRYNAYFAAELDAEGKPLTQHIVGERQLWRIMEREWKVDPKKFGIKEPAPLPSKWGAQEAKPEKEPARGKEPLMLGAPQNNEGIGDEL